MIVGSSPIRAVRANGFRSLVYNRYPNDVASFSRDSVMAQSATVPTCFISEIVRKVVLQSATNFTYKNFLK
jgi:hypothetical protein